MKQVIDSQTVNERMNELRWNAQKIQGYASRIYSICGADPDFDQLMRILQAKDYFETTSQAEYVLLECAEKRNKRLTLREDDRIKFKRFAANDRTPLHRNKYLKGDSFVIDKGTVAVDEKKVRKLLEAEHVVTVDDKNDTTNKWIANLVTVINQAPDKGLRNRLGRFILMQNEALKGVKVVVNGDDLQVIDL